VLLQLGAVNAIQTGQQRNVLLAVLDNFGPLVENLVAAAVPRDKQPTTTLSDKAPFYLRYRRDGALLLNALR